MPPRQLRARKDLTTPSAAPAASSRPRRAVTTQHPATTIERSSPDDARHSSIRLTVKSDPRKLKEATGGLTTRSTIAVKPRDTFVPAEIVSGPRQTRKKPIVESDSEEEEEDDLELENSELEEDEEEDADGELDEDAIGDLDEDEEEEEEEEEEEDEDLDAEGEEDTEMIDAPLPSLPISKPSVPTISVEQKEMAMDDDDDDEELSSLDEDAEGEIDIGEEDAEGEDDDELDSDGELASNSRGGTPDLNKLTRRQRAAFEEYGGGLMALSNGMSNIPPLLYILANANDRGTKKEALDC
jgi:Ino eighty subunit 2